MSGPTAVRSRRRHVAVGRVVAGKARARVRHRDPGVDEFRQLLPGEAGPPRRVALEPPRRIGDRCDGRLPRFRPQDPAQGQQPRRPEADALQRQRLDVERHAVEGRALRCAEGEHRAGAAYVDRRLHEPGQVPGDDADAFRFQSVDEEPELLRLDDVDRAAVVRRLHVDGAHPPRCDLRRRRSGAVIGGCVVDVDPGPEPCEHLGVRARCRLRTARCEHEGCGNGGEGEAAHFPECTNEV
jgi:hypothetical protein